MVDKLSFCHRHEIFHYMFQVDEKFAQLQDFLVGKPYVQHLITPFFAVDNTLDDSTVGSISSY